MINVKKGSAHSLQQSDVRGLAKASEGVVAGMLCRINASGQVVKGPTNAAAADDLLGFAINNQTDGDVIESKKIALYLLDGSSVLETDQADATINLTNYPVGTRLGAGATAGKVRAWESGDRVIGYVEGVRALPSSPSVSQDYLDLDGNTQTKTQATQKMINVLGIKLAA